MYLLRPLCWVALLAAGTAALVAIYGLGAVGISGQYELLWGTQLIAGERVELDAPFAPTPHPLTIAIAGLVAQLGGADVAALSIVQLIALAGTLVALWLFAAELFDRRVATLSIGLLTLCPQILLWSFDGPKSSLWIIGLVLAGRAELRTRRAGAGVLWPLALLGLVRPEAWALAALYCGWLWCDRDRRGALHALAVVGPPLVWMGFEWVMTGDPLASMHRTHALRAALERETGAGAALTGLPGLLNEPLGSTLALIGLLGIVLAVWGGHPRARGTLAVMVVLALSFVAQSAAGFSVIANYLVPLHLLLLVFAAATLLARWSLRPSHQPKLALVAMSLTAAAILVQAPERLERHNSTRADVRALARAWTQLEAVVSRADARTSCGAVDLSGPYAPRALLALHLGTRASRLRDGTMQPSRPGLHIVPTHRATGRALASFAFVRREPRAPAGARLVRGNEIWSLWELCSPGDGLQVGGPDSPRINAAGPRLPRAPGRGT